MAHQKIIILPILPLSLHPKGNNKIFLRKNILVLINTTSKFPKTINLKDMMTLGPKEMKIIGPEDNRSVKENNNIGFQEDNNFERNINHQKVINLPEMK